MDPVKRWQDDSDDSEMPNSKLSDEQQEETPPEEQS